jgi:TonB family protein
VRTDWMKCSEKRYAEVTRGMPQAWGFALLLLLMPALGHGAPTTGQGDAPSPAIELAIDKDGAYSLDGRAASLPTLQASLMVAAVMAPQPVLNVHVSGDSDLAAISGSLKTAIDSAWNAGLKDAYVYPPETVAAKFGGDGSPIHYRHLPAPSLVLLVTVNAKGCATDAIVLSSSGAMEFDAVAVEAAKGWHYSPTSKSAVPNGMQDVTVAVEFQKAPAPGTRTILASPMPHAGQADTSGRHQCHS